MLIAAAAAMFAACQQEDVVIDQSSNLEKAIGFGTYTPNLTRAENSDGEVGYSLKNYHNTFKVYGYKTVGAGAEQKVFNGQVCTWTEKASLPTTGEFSGISTESYGDWVYSPVRYWDKTALYDFYAFAPSKVDFAINETTADAHYFTLSSYTVAGKSLAQSTTVTGQPDDVFGKDNTTNEDLMIATDVKDCDYVPQRVNFDFNHILSRLNIAVKTTIPAAVAASGSTPASGATVTINAIKVFNMKTKGAFDESAVSGTDLQKGTIARWKPTDAKNTTGVGVKFDSEGKGTSSEYVKEATTYYPSAAKSNVVTEVAKYFYQGLVLPQAAKYEPIALDGTGVGATSEPYLYINYTITYATGEVETNIAYYNLAEAFNASVPVRNSLGYPAYETKTPGTYAYFFADNWYKEDGTLWTDVEMEKDANSNVIPVYTTGNEKDQISFFEGWQNNLTISIEPLAILFSADVYKWVTKYGGNLTVN